MKTLLKILIIVIVLGLIGYGAYWFFNQREAGVTNPFSDGVSVGDFFPFGTGGTTTGPDTTGNTVPNQNQIDTVPTTPQQLWTISSEPQSGAIIFNASSTPFVRYVDKATGNIMESKLTLTGSTRISNTTVPKVYNALWQNDGKMLVLQYLASDKETVKSVMGKLSAPSTRTEGSFQELTTTFLPDNVQSLSVDAQTGTLAYLTINQAGSKIFVTTAKTPKQIFDSVIKDFSITWVNKATISLATKPSAAAAGQLYFLKSDNGLLSRVMGGQFGLSALANPGATQVIYSETSGSSFKTSTFDIKSGVTNTLTLNTLADKCVWSAKNTVVYCAVPKGIPNGRYPDDWYQGKTTFDDGIWQIDTLTGTTRIIADPEGVGAHIDAVNLVLDPNEKYMVFTNKKDSKLWGLKL